jgi:hypothetical protein
MSDKRRDIATAMVFLALGLGTIVYLIPQGVTVPSTIKVAALSPDFWPRLITYGAIAASVFLLIETLTMHQPKGDAEIPQDAAHTQMAPWLGLLRALVLVVALFAFYASLTTLGIVAASVVLLCAMMLFFGERKLWLVALLSFAVPVVLYLFFRYVASVPIPLGIFGT